MMKIIALAILLTFAACSIDQPETRTTSQASTECVSDPIAAGGGDIDQDFVAHCPTPEQRARAATYTYAADNYPPPTNEVEGGCHFSDNATTCVLTVWFGDALAVLIVCQVNAVGDVSCYSE